VFLGVFFPEIHHHINFSSMKPLLDEMFTNLIIETELKEHDTLVIIYVETTKLWTINVIRQQV
jgi:hypothetical protein